MKKEYNAHDTKDRKWIKRVFSAGSLRRAIIFEFSEPKWDQCKYTRHSWHNKEISFVRKHSISWSVMESFTLTIMPVSSPLSWSLSSTKGFIGGVQNTGDFREVRLNLLNGLKMFFLAWDAISPWLASEVDDELLWWILGVRKCFFALSNGGSF